MNIQTENRTLAAHRHRTLALSDTPGKVARAFRQEECLNVQTSRTFKRENFRGKCLSPFPGPRFSRTSTGGAWPRPCGWRRRRKKSAPPRPPARPCGAEVGASLTDSGQRVTVPPRPRPLVLSAATIAPRWPMLRPPPPTGQPPPPAVQIDFSLPLGKTAPPQKNAGGGNPPPASFNPRRPYASAASQAPRARRGATRSDRNTAPRRARPSAPRRASNSAPACAAMAASAARSAAPPVPLCNRDPPATDSASAVSSPASVPAATSARTDTTPPTSRSAHESRMRCARLRAAAVMTSTPSPLPSSNQSASAVSLMAAPLMAAPNAAARATACDSARRDPPSAAPSAARLSLLACVPSVTSECNSRPARAPAAAARAALKSPASNTRAACTTDGRRVAARRRPPPKMAPAASISAASGAAPSSAAASISAAADSISSDTRAHSLTDPCKRQSPPTSLPSRPPDPYRAACISRSAIRAAVMNTQPRPIVPIESAATCRPSAVHATTGSPSTRRPRPSAAHCNRSTSPPDKPRATSAAQGASGARTMATPYAAARIKAAREMPCSSPIQSAPACLSSTPAAAPTSAAASASLRELRLSHVRPTAHPIRAARADARPCKRSAAA